MRPARRILAGILVLAGSSLGAQPLDPSLYGDLRWRLVGPFRAGWANGAPKACRTSPATYYFGNGGRRSLENAGCGPDLVADLRPRRFGVGRRARASLRRIPRVIYAGTGQIQARYDIASGRRRLSLRRRRRDLAPPRARADRGRSAGSSSIPKNPTSRSSRPSATSSARTGSAASSGPRTAGRAGSQVLFVDESTGGADLAADPENPSIVYASVWQARNFPWLSYFQPMVGSGQRRLQVFRRGANLEAPLRRGLAGRRPRTDRTGGLAGRTRLGARRRGESRRASPLARRRAPSVRRRRRDVGARQRDPGAGLELHEPSDGRSARPRRRLRDGAVHPALGGRGQDAAVFSRRSRRGRLPLPLDQSEEPRVHGHGGRSGHDRHGQRREVVERLVQPADRPVLPRRNRRPVSLQRSTAASRTAAPSERRAAATTDPHVPRLAARRRRRARLGRSGSPGPADIVYGSGLGGHGHALRHADGPGAQHLSRRREHLRAPAGSRGVSLGLGLSPGDVAQGSPRALRRLAVPAALSRLGGDLGEGEPRSLGSGPEREGLQGDGHSRERAALRLRRHLHDRAVAAR